LELELALGAPHRCRMISRCIAVLLAVSLAGCCASGVGCNAPASGAPVAWDGLGSAPAENTIGDDSATTESAAVEHKKVRRTASHVDARSQAGDRFEQQQAADQNADAKLNKQLKICSNC
jgi:hypothetical protein